MDKARQLLLSMLCGFGADHDLVRDAVADPQASEQLRQGNVTIEKDDLFARLSTGRTIFEYREAWRNFDKILGAAKNGGGAVSYDDFKKQAASGETLIDLAVRYGYADRLFFPGLWAGKSEKEMTAAWLQIDAGERNKYDFTLIRREAARAQGREIREDQLARMSLTPDHIRLAIREGRYKPINDKFSAHGDHLRKDDLFIFDKSGDHMLDSRDSWERFPLLIEQLDAQGEKIGADDFLFRLGGKKSMLDYAESYNQLDKIFNAAVWRGRPADMLRLYGHLPQSFRRDALKVPDLFTKLVTDEYGAAIRVDAALTRAALVTPLNEKDRSLAGADFRPVVALGLEPTWKKIDEVRKILAACGERLTLADLRQPSGYYGESCLRLAARFQQFDKVMEILKDSGERLPVDDLKAEGKDGKSLLSLLAENHGIGAIMQPELWVGHGAEFLDVWKALPSWEKRDVNFQTLQSRINQLSLRERFGKRPAAPAP